MDKQSTIEGQLCKARLKHMSQTIYKTKVSSYVNKSNHICMISMAMVLNLKQELNSKHKRPLGLA